MQGRDLRSTADMPAADALQRIAPHETNKSPMHVSSPPKNGMDL